MSARRVQRRGRQQFGAGENLAGELAGDETRQQRGKFAGVGRLEPRHSLEPVERAGPFAGSGDFGAGNILRLEFLQPRRAIGAQQAQGDMAIGFAGDLAVQGQVEIVLAAERGDEILGVIGVERGRGEQGGEFAARRRRWRRPGEIAGQTGVVERAMGGGQRQRATIEGEVSSRRDLMEGQ